MKSILQRKWAFILLGDNNTGKTTLQKNIIEILFGYTYKKLPSNQRYPIKHSAFRNLESIFIMGRSFQEKYRDNKIDSYFENDFIKCDICILSSHVNDETSNCLNIVSQMIDKCHERKFNVAAVYFTNATYRDKAIFNLPWNLRINMNNRRKLKEEEIIDQIKGMAEEFTGMLLREFDK